MFKKQVEDGLYGDVDTSYLEKSIHPSTPDDVVAAIKDVKENFSGDGGKAIEEYIRKIQWEYDALIKKSVFKHKKGRPLFIVKLGSEGRGWVPNQAHFNKVQRVLKDSGMDEKYNILLYHFGIDTTIVGKEV